MNIITSPRKGYQQPIMGIKTHQKQGIAGPLPTWTTTKPVLVTSVRGKLIYTHLPRLHVDILVPHYLFDSFSYIYI